MRGIGMHAMSRDGAVYLTCRLFRCRVLTVVATSAIHHLRIVFGICGLLACTAFSVSARELPVESVGTMEHLRDLAVYWEVEYPDGALETEILEAGDPVGRDDAGRPLPFRQRALFGFNRKHQLILSFILKVEWGGQVTIWINGHQLRVYETQKKWIDGDFRIIHLPRKYLYFDRPNEIVIEVTPQTVREDHVRRVMISRENGLSNAIDPDRFNLLSGQLYTFFCLFVAYFNLIYFIRRPTDTFHFFFFLGNLMLAGYFYRMSFDPLFLGLITSLKLSKAAVPIGVGSFALSFVYLFEFYNPRRVKRVIIPLVLLSALFILLSAPKEGVVYTNFGRAMVGVVPILLFMFHISFKAFRRGRRDARIIITGFGIGLICALHDAFFLFIQVFDQIDRFDLEPVLWLQGLGLFIFNLSIFTALVMRSIRARSDLELYTVKVEELVADRTAELDRMNAEATAANRAKSDFLANVSHEMRTPLNAIMGFGEALEEKLMDSDRESAALIVSESRRLTELIDQLLDLSKIEAGRLDLVEEPFDLAELLHSVEGILGPKARQKGIGLKLDIDPAIPQLVLGDGLRLRQVLINLIDNGIKFTPEGEVILSASLLSKNDGIAYLEFRIRDTGIGIEQQYLDRLFDKFYQIEEGRTRGASGFGLGTAIAKLIIEKMAGTIRVASEPGRGTEFTLQVHLQEAQADLLDNPRILLDAVGEELLPADCRILVADDYETNLKIVEYHLAAAGCRVESVPDGYAALERAAAERYDLILMDISMPGLDGVETARRLRARGIATPIVAMTANAYHQEFAVYWEAGMNDILIKPFRKAELLGVVSRLCRDPSATRESRALAAAVLPDGGDAEALIDIPGLESDFDGDREMLKALVGGFCLDTEERLPRMRQAISNGRSENLQRESHAIKGGARNLRAIRLGAAAERLEQKARAGYSLQALPQFDEMEREYRRLYLYLRDETDLLSELAGEQE